MSRFDAPPPRADRSHFDASHPENDPSHPRYEPPHLRHQPGDTWQIGGRPYDPDDPGPYGNPLWRPDTRTGRHRRGELPDPPAPEPEPSPPPIGDRPSPSPRRQRFWTETDRDRRPLQDETNHEHHHGHRFDRLREDAWDDFMTDSAPLAAAHTEQSRPRRQSAIEREAGGAWALWIALAKWLFALIRSTRNEHRQSQTTQDRRQPGTETDPHRQNRPPAAASAPSQRTPHPRNCPTARSTAMARAVAGAQRARAGVPAWA